MKLRNIELEYASWMNQVFLFIFLYKQFCILVYLLEVFYNVYVHPH